MEHLVYCDKKAGVLDKILAGEKTMIVRGAAGRKLPYGRVFDGETLYFVENDGSQTIRAKAKVKSVNNTDPLTEDESIEMIAANQSALRLSEAQIKRWAGKKRLCLVEICEPEPVEPMVYERRKNMDDWIIVEDIRSILEGSSETYVNPRIK